MYTIRATDRDRRFVVCRTPYLQKKKVAIQPPFYRSAFVYHAQEESPKWHWPNCFQPSLPFHMGEGKEKTLVIISQLGKLPLQGVSILPHRTSSPFHLNAQWQAKRVSDFAGYPNRKGADDPLELGERTQVCACLRGWSENEIQRLGERRKSSRNEISLFLLSKIHQWPGQESEFFFAGTS